MTRLDGKGAIVTGGGSSLGKAIGKALAAQRGVKVVLSDINVKGAERVAAEIRGAGGHDIADSSAGEPAIVGGCFGHRLGPRILDHWKTSPWGESR